MNRNASFLFLAAAVGAVAHGCKQAESLDGSQPTAGASGAAGAPVGSAPVGPIAGTAPLTPAAGMGGVGGMGGSGPAGAGVAGSGGVGGSAGGGAGTGGSSAGEGGTGDAGLDSGDGMESALTFAAGLHELFIHDACTAPNPSQPDTCIHAQETEEVVTFGGETGMVYDVTLRIRGLFEPTTINGGQAPLPAHPYFKIGGTIGTADYSQWQIEVSDPAATFYLNHYPSVSHTIYQEDFEAQIPVAGGAEVMVRVVDGNDRQIDNGNMGPPDRRQLIDGVTTEVLNGQVLRLDVIDVEAQ